jgi:transcription antitermination factor NusG
LWRVAHTKPRQEKALAEALIGLGVPCFLPLVPKVRFYAHRKRAVDLPLFPSYVFVACSPEQHLMTLQTQRVVQLLAVHDQAGLERELGQIDRALAGGAALEPYPFLSLGRRVVVRQGPFEGMEGLVDARVSPHRVVLNVSLLGRATSVEVDASLLESID